MGNKVLLLFLAVLCTACGTVPDPRPTSEVDPEFAPYVKHFEATYEVNSSSAIQFVSELPKGEHGQRLAQCRVFKVERGVGAFKTIKRFRYVEVHEDFWPNLSEQRKLALIYHELIHCDFVFSGHIDDTHSDGCATNIMNTFLPSDYCLDTYWDSYVDYWR